MKTLDVCGISCPEPLIRLKEALKTEKDLLVLTDSKNAHDNCIDYAKKHGFDTMSSKEGEVFKITVSKN